MTGCLESFVPHSAMISMTLRGICPILQSGYVVRVEHGCQITIGRTAQVLILTNFFA